MMGLSARNERVKIGVESGELDAGLWVPEDAAGIVVLACEYSHQRLGCVGDYLPSVLREARLATLVFDIGCGVAASGPAIAENKSEERNRDARQCLRGACDWVQQHAATAGLPLGLAGMGIGGAVALEVAAGLGRSLCALVARGTRGDVEASALPRISAPTLLIAGGLDDAAVRCSRNAYAALRCRKRFEIVPGATRTFEEPGSLEVVARLMRCWFVQYVHQSA